MRVFNELEPKRVFYYFEDLCKIPHGSGNTGKISDYCVKFAIEHGFEYIKDSHNNVVIKKPASKGYETHEPVMIQGHLDMVCEKEPDFDIDFLTDGLDIAVDGDYVYANGTTLGGDDGIAVAMALAILESNDIAHPPIEAVFTTDEETGMFGADGLDTSVLKAKTLINADSENEGILTVSCAGGARAEITMPLVSSRRSKNCKTITVDGLIGGHSGVEIDKGRLNSNILMGDFLKSLPFEFELGEISGGLKDNAIPRRTDCIISCDGDLTAAALAFVRSHIVESDPDLKIHIDSAIGEYELYDVESSKKIADILSALPNGVQAMSEDIKGLVQTSLNLGVLTVKNGIFTATFSVRSSKNEEKAALLDILEDISDRFGGAFASHGHYPAWEYRKVSRLRDVMVNTYKSLYGKEPTVEAVHAGLECGLFCDKIPDLDAVSFGPDMCDIHTTREKLSISSAKRTYEYLCEILKRL